MRIDPKITIDLRGRAGGCGAALPIAGHAAPAGAPKCGAVGLVGAPNCVTGDGEGANVPVSAAAPEIGAGGAVVTPGQELVVVGQEPVDVVGQEPVDVVGQEPVDGG